VVRGVDIWSALEHPIARCSADLIVLGTHGRTGAEKLLLGSAAEEIFRQARVPVLTIGPAVRNGIHSAARFNRVLCATDFSAESLAATRFAVSLAAENQARLVLLHVIRDPGSEAKLSRETHSVANVMYRLHGLVPKDAELWCRPEAVVEYGEPAERILEAAKQRGADLIVMGMRHGRGTATQLERSVATKCRSCHLPGSDRPRLSEMKGLCCPLGRNYQLGEKRVCRYR
jgi:nucleotide-binding universal stress UspA family protein